MGKFIDIKGQRFGFWTVIERVNSIHKKTFWLCHCDCGNESIVDGQFLREGRSKSCGCHKIEVTKQRLTTHGKSSTEEYNIWICMKKRCYDPTVSQYKYYGGRGIKVCQRWSNSFENFLEDMGKRPSQKHSIDRINLEGDYCPENCRWATQQQQMRHTTNTKMLTLYGKTQSMIEWSEELNINYSLIRSRKRSGWSDERTLLTPPRQKLKDRRIN